MFNRDNAKAVMAWIAPVTAASSFFMWVINMQIEKAVSPIRTEVHSIAVSIDDMKLLAKTMQTEREESVNRETTLENRLLNIEERLAFNDKAG